MKPRWIAPFALFVVVAVGACNRLPASMDLERMIDQAKFEAYEHGVMRHPPAGTVARERLVDSGLEAEQYPGGPHRRDIPITVDRALLDRGRDRYERFCAACHGIAGYGNPAVAENMALRPPPSLHEPRIANQPVGHIFKTITDGYGLMPSYQTELDPRDRWAVIAYLQVLWLSQRVELARLPADLQTRARSELR